MKPSIFTVKSGPNFFNPNNDALVKSLFLLAKRKEKRQSLFLDKNVSIKNNETIMTVKAAKRQSDQISTLPMLFERIK